MLGQLQLNANDLINKTTGKGNALQLKSSALKHLEQSPSPQVSRVQQAVSTRTVLVKDQIYRPQNPVDKTLAHPRRPWQDARQAEIRKARER